MCAVLISKALRLAGVNERSYSFTCHPHVYTQVERTIPAFNPQLQSIAALWPVLISRPALGRRLRWPGWLGEILKESPIQYEPLRPEIELATVELQVQRHNH